MSAVSRLKKIVATLLLVSWLPATSWCFVERAGWAVADDDGSPVGESSQIAPCWNVSSSIYKFANHHREPTQMPREFGAPLSNPLGLDLVQNAIDCVEFGVAPPELSKRWHFSFRTALLPRAPSSFLTDSSR